MKRRYELTKIPSLDKVPETGDVVIEGANEQPGLLPIHMLMTALMGPVDAQISELEYRVGVLENGFTPSPPAPEPPPAIVPPTILTNDGQDMTVTVNEGVETVSQLSAEGSFPIVWERSGPNASMFFVDSQSWDVSFRNPPAPGSYSVTLTARNGGAVSDSFTLTVQVSAVNLVAPSIVGDSSLGTTLTPMSGGYAESMLYWMRDGEVVQVGSRAYGKSTVDANKQIVLAAMSGGTVIAQSQPITVVSGGVAASDQYAKVFADSFSSDLSRFTDSGKPQNGKQVWRTRYSWDRDAPINYEWQRITAPEDTGNGTTPLGIQMLSIVPGGGLDLNVRRATASEIPNYNWEDDSHYAAAAAYGSDRAVEKWFSPVVSQQRGFNCQYSYNELEVSAPVGRAMWFAGWLLSTELTWPPEFDFPETDGARDDKAYLSAHKLDANGNKVSIGSGWQQMPDKINKRIRIGLEWTPTRAAYYFDGVEVWSVDNHDIHHRMFWVLNMAVGSGTYDGTWVMPPDASSPSPTKATVHSVRSYQRPSFRSLAPTMVSRPIMYIQGDTATIIPGRSNASSVTGYLRSGTVKIPGTDNVTTFNISSLRPTNTGAGINLNYGEMHVMADDTVDVPRRRFVNSQMFWVTANSQGYLQEPSHDYKYLTKIDIGPQAVWRPTGYTGPWAYLPNENSIGNWVKDVDYSNDFWHDTSMAFPAGSRLEWNYLPWASSEQNFSYGHAGFMYGAGPSGYPFSSTQHPVPTKAGEFQSFTVTYDISIGGNVVPNDVVIDVYTVADPANLNGTHVNRVSIYPHMLRPDQHDIQHDFGGNLGLCSIYKQPTSEQIMVRPITEDGVPRSIMRGTFDIKSVLDELIVRGLVSQAAYVVGFEFSNEPQMPNWWNTIPCEGWWKFNNAPIVNWSANPTQSYALSVGEQRNISGTGGTTIPGLAANSTWSTQFVRHQYSKVNPWNADGSILQVTNRDSTPPILFLDGRMLTPLNLPAFNCNEMRWHPTDPNLAYIAVGNQLIRRNVVTGAQTILYTNTAYSSLAIGPGEGNLSDDGQWCVVGVGNGSWPDPPSAILLVNTITGVAQAVTTGFGYVDWASVSPSGAYVVVNGGVDINAPDRTKVFARTNLSTPIQHWTEYGRPSHFDLTIDAAGDEVAVGVSKSAPDEGKVIKRRLSDGQVTVLTSYGYGWHTSTRNTNARQLGALVSFANVPEHPTRRDQGVLVNIDNPGTEIVVIPALGFSAPDNYWNQPQPSISPDGNQVIWAAPDANGRVSTFVRRIS